MLLSSKLQLCLLAIAFVSTLDAHSDSVKKPQLMVKNFAKIDSHLSKKVPTHDVKLFMQEIDAWIKKESNKFIRNKSLIEDLKRFKLIEQIQSVEHCHDGFGRTFLEQFDKSLGYDAATMGGSPIRPIDKIAKYYAYNFTEFCRDQTEFMPNLESTFKQTDYDIIDAHLVSKVATNDFDNNLNEASKMMSQAPVGSHLAESLEQFLSLRTLVSGRESCNYNGYQIRFQNDLAIRGEFKVKVASRRIDQIITEASKKHDTICHGEYRKNYNTLIKNLDGSVKKTMRSLAVNYLKPLSNLVWDYDLMEPARSIGITGEEELDTSEPQNRFVSDSEVIAAKETVDFMVEGSDDSNFCQAFGNSRTKMVNLDRLYQCYDKYLIKPCRIFMETVGKEVFVPQFYNPSNDETISLPTREDDELPLSYNHGQAASLVCTRLIKNYRWISLRLAEKEVGL